jgi:carbon storage regulator
MLVLSRKLAERIRLKLPDGSCVWLWVVDIDRGKVRLGVDAPRDVEVMREELIPPGEQRQGAD